jgi:putative hydrolase of the HAD superfamily
MKAAVLFDLDRTLLDRDTSFLNFASSQYDLFAKVLSRVSKHDYVTSLITLDNKGYTPKDKVYQSLVNEFGLKNLDPSKLMNDFQTRFTSYSLPFPGLFEMLRDLKSHGYLIGLITNGRGDMQRGKIRAISIETYFDDIGISEIEGVKKPHPEIFLRALKRLGSQACSSLFVGDSPEVDIRGARSAGMKTAWKQQPEWPHIVETDATFDHLAEIFPIDKKLNPIKS